MNNTELQFINILRQEICGRVARADGADAGGDTAKSLDSSCADASERSAVFALAKKHKMDGVIARHFIDEEKASGAETAQAGGTETAQARAANTAQASESLCAQMQRSLDTELFRAATFDIEMAAMDEALTRKGIDYVPLKGAVIRDFYPEKWMRSSKDIDILVRPEDKERATKVLSQIPGYKLLKKTAHHNIFGTSNGWMIELHFMLTDHANPGTPLLKRAWEFVRCGDVTGAADAASEATVAAAHARTFTAEFFYTYFMYHMAHDFVSGGCGIRPLLDLYLMRSGEPGPACHAMLREAELETFAEQMEQLSKGLFGETLSISDEQKTILDYIFVSGANGSEFNAQIMQRAREKDGSSYAKNRIFISDDELTRRFPSFPEHKWARPFYQIARWGKSLFAGRAGSKLSQIKEMSEGGDAAAGEMLDCLGLTNYE